MSVDARVMEDHYCPGGRSVGERRSSVRIKMIIINVMTLAAENHKRTSKVLAAYLPPTATEERGMGKVRASYDRRAMR